MWLQTDNFSPFLSQLHHLQLWPHSLSDPLDALLLWVNDEWPALTGGQDGSILGRHPIIWQALVMPGSHSGIVCNHEDWIQAVCQGYRDLEQKLGNDVTLAEALVAEQHVCCKKHFTFWEWRKGIQVFFRRSSRYSLVKEPMYETKADVRRTSPHRVFCCFSYWTTARDQRSFSDCKIQIHY